MLMKIAIILIINLHIGYSTFEAPSWTTTNYIKSGTTIIVESANYQNNPWEGPYVTTYATAFVNTPQTALGLINLEYNNEPTDIKYSFFIQDFSSKTHMKIKAQYVGGTLDFKKVRISWLAVDSVQIQYLSLDYIHHDFTTENVAQTSSSNERYTEGTKSIAQSQNTDNVVSVIPMLIGLVLTATNSKQQFRWMTSLKNSTYISYNLTAYGLTTISQIKSYVVILDKTQTQATKQLFLDEFYPSGTDSNVGSVSLIYSNPINLHVGLNSFSINSWGGGGFNFEKATLKLSATGSYSSLNLSGMSFRKRICSASLPYYESDINLCYDQCKSTHIGQTAASGQKYCQLCSKYITQCSNCQSTTKCTSCHSPYVVASDNTSCECATTHYMDNGECFECHPYCKSCVGSTENNCSSCDGVERKLNGNMCECVNGVENDGSCQTNCTGAACISCPNFTYECELCRTTFELVNKICACPDKYYYDPGNEKCYDCHITCAQCQGPASNQCDLCNQEDNRQLNVSECLCKDSYGNAGNGSCQKVAFAECPDGFELIKSFCYDICGDGYHIQVQCDDGNLQNGDGCSDSCKIQDHFSCSPGIGKTTPSICSYNGSINFYVISAWKDMFSNHISLKYQMQPSLKFWVDYDDLSQLIVYINKQVTTKSITYDINLKTLNMELDYNQSIHLKDLLFQFTPPVSPATRSLVASNSSWQVKSDNNLAVIYYEIQVYQSLKIIHVFSIIALAGYFITFIGGLFFRKIIGMQLAFLFQFCYLSISTIDFTQALLGPIASWQFVFGYNKWQPTPNEAQPIPYNYTILGYQRYFGYSFNVMFLVILIFYVIAISLYLISTLLGKSSARKCKQAGIIFARQIAFGLVVFSIPNIVTAFTLQFYTGAIGDFSLSWSKAIMIVSILMILVHFIVFALTYEDSVESYIFYRKNFIWGQLHPLYLITRNILITVFLVLHINMQAPAFYVIFVIQTIYIAIIAALRPYKRNIDFARSIIIQTSLLFVMIARFIQADLIDVQHSEGGLALFNSKSPYIQISLLLFCVIFSLVCFFFHLFKSINRENQIIPDNSQTSSFKILDDQSRELEVEVKSRGIYDNNEIKHHVEIQDIEETDQQPVYNISLDDYSPSKRKLNPE